MTPITFNTELRAASCGLHTPERQAAVAASHVAMFKGFWTLALTMGLLTVLAVGTIALKTAIWIPHFN